MESAQPLIHPDSVLTIDVIREHFKRRTSGEDWRLVNAANATLAIMEHKIGRAIKERLWINSVTRTLDVTLDTETVAGTTLDVLKPGMDVLGANLAMGTRIVSIASAVAMDIRPAPITTNATMAATIGSAPHKMRHPGGCDIALPTYPATELFSIATVESDGTRTPLDITDHILDEESGLVHLVTESPSRGAHIEIECRAGYRAPTPTDRGHARDWFVLQHLAIRIMEVLFNDYAMLLGHTVEVNLGQNAIRFLDLSMPRDVQALIDDYAEWRV